MKCSVDGCEKIAKSKGFCSMHYHRQYRHGKLDKPKTKREELIEKGFSYCPKCDGVKEISEFNKDKHAAFGIAIYCRKCNKTKSKLQYSTHKNYHKNTQLKSDFNITLDEYNKILDAQNNGCAICGKTEKENGKMLAVDHDHNSNIVRGLLCSNCNLGLGKFCDNIDLLNNAIKYLNNER